MAALVLKNVNCDVLVISSIYDKLDKIDSIKKLIKKYEIVIINGNLSYPPEGADERLNLWKNEIFQQPKVIYNLGNHDFIYTTNKKNTWLEHNPNVVFIDFNNQTNVIITNGGLTPKMSKVNLLDNLETSFVSLIQQKPWHERYNGKFGYIVSNLPLDSEPRFYSYSMSLGTNYDLDKTFAQEISAEGLKKTILL
jgi:hypothetical protein